MKLRNQISEHDKLRNEIESLASKAQNCRATANERAASIAPEDDKGVREITELRTKADVCDARIKTVQAKIISLEALMREEWGVVRGIAGQRQRNALAKDRENFFEFNKRFWPAGMPPGVEAELERPAMQTARAGELEMATQGSHEFEWSVSVDAFRGENVIGAARFAVRVIETLDALKA